MLFLLGVLLLLGVASPLTAYAESDNSAERVRQWLSQLQAAGATVQVDAVETLTDGGSVRARNLAIEAPSAAGQKVKIVVGALTLSGAGDTASAYRVGQAHADKLRVTFGDAYFEAAALDLTNVALPRSVSTAMDAQHPTASLVRFARAALAVQAGDVRLTGLAWALPGAGVDAVDTLGLLSAINIDGGAIASLRLRDFRASRRTPASETRIAEAVAERISPAALLDLIDPQTYRAPLSPRSWRLLVGHAAITGLDMRAAESRTALQQIDIGRFELRPFAFDPTPILDIAATAPAKLREQPGLTTAFGDGLAESLRVATLSVRGFASDDGADPPKRRTQAEALDIVDLAPRTAKSIRASALQILAGDSGLRVDSLGASGVELAAGAPTPTFPRFSSLAMERIVLVRPGVDATLGSIKIEAGDYIGRTPTHIDGSLEGLSIPVEDLPESALRANLSALKVERLKLNVSLAADWQEAAEQLNIASARLDVAGLGALSASASLIRVPRAAFEHPESLADLTQAAAVKQAQLNFRDSGLAGRVLAKFAEVNKVSVEKVRSALTSNMPTLFGAITDAASRNRLIFAAIGFLNDPRTISVFTTLETPTPLLKVIEAGRTAPQALPGLLKLDALANRPS